MLTVPFLTELDSRAAVNGSRDPLGVKSIWPRLGRQVVWDRRPSPLPCGTSSVLHQLERDFLMTG